MIQLIVDCIIREQFNISFNNILCIIYINKVDPRIVPWATPDVPVDQLECVPRIVTLCCPFVKRFLNHNNHGHPSVLKEYGFMLWTVVLVLGIASGVAG